MMIRAQSERLTGMAWARSNWPGSRSQIIQPTPTSSMSHPASVMARSTARESRWSRTTASSTAVTTTVTASAEKWATPKSGIEPRSSSAARTVAPGVMRPTLGGDLPGFSARALSGRGPAEHEPRQRQGERQENAALGELRRGRHALGDRCEEADEDRTDHQPGAEEPDLPGPPPASGGHPAQADPGHREDDHRARDADPRGRHEVDGQLEPDPRRDHRSSRDLRPGIPAVAGLRGPGARDCPGGEDKGHDDEEDDDGEHRDRPAGAESVAVGLLAVLVDRERDDRCADESE